MSAKKVMKVEVPTIVEREITYWFFDWDGDMDEADVEHITSRLSEGYIQGQLVTTDPDDENKTHLGWWKLVTEEL